MSASSLQEWPRAMLRAVSSSFTLGSLSGQEQPIFKARAPVFGDPFEQRFFCTFQSPALGELESFSSGSGSEVDRRRPSFREVEGRIAKLRGMSGLVRVFDPFNFRPYWNLPGVSQAERSNWSDGSTWADGSQWVSGFLPPVIVVDENAEAGAESIVVRGLPVSLARVLRIGDPFEGIPGNVRPEYGEYHKIVDDATSNGSGKTRIYFQPGLRGKLNAGDQIRLNYPTTVMSLVDDKQGEVQRGLVTGSFGVTLVEVLPSE
jgi:hypothetical protein